MGPGRSAASSYLFVGRTMHKIISCAMLVLLASVTFKANAATDTYNVVFPENIDVSVCAGKNLLYSSQNIQVDQTTGAFSEVWSPTSPNTLACAGQLLATSVSATLQC